MKGLLPNVAQRVPSSIGKFEQLDETSMLNYHLEHVCDVRWSLIMKSLINQHGDSIINSLLNLEPVQFNDMNLPLVMQSVLLDTSPFVVVAPKVSC